MELQEIIQSRRQGMPLNRSVDKFLDGLDGFADDFGDGEALRQAITRLRERPEMLAKSSPPTGE
jgi:hypothetical protein